MAKTQLKNYVFRPGIGATGNRYPDAYSLLAENKLFLQKEINPYINDRISLAKQYTPEDASYNPTTGVLELTIIPLTQYTPTNASYNPTTGVMEITIGAHSFVTNDYIRIAEEGLTFTCDLDDNATEHPYPRSTGSNYPGGADPFYNKPIRIIGTTTSTITVNVGISSNTSDHTFASATANAVSATHNLYTGDAILIAQNSLAFTNDSGPVTIDNGTSPYQIKAIEILDTDVTSITVNIGTSQETSTHEFVSADANAITDVFFGYTNTSQAKCERDLGYVIDAYLHDLRYGGNESTIKAIQYYWDQDVAQVDGDRGAEIAAHNFVGRLIKEYIFVNARYERLNSQQAQIIDNTKTVSNFAFTPTDAEYTPTTGDLTLTIGSHDLTVNTEIFIAPSSITFTCALDGNSTLHPYPRRSGVPNDTGKDPFYYAPTAITAVTDDTITVNIGISSDTSDHTFVSATANSVTSGPFAKIDTLVFNTVDVIANGLTALPNKIRTGIGTVKVQGRFDLEDFLLITNTTSNEIIYNFAISGSGGHIEFKTDKVTEDEDYPKFLQTTDAITTLTLDYDTSGHSDTDELQIFVEKVENGKSITTVRPFDFGTDAIERMRVATPLSMLDADFEYGLQPTKWAAIGTLRGYPSVYELPGTETPVLSVTTDASAGTSGIGQSLITVTTVGAHGFIAGTPITIKALEDAVVGAARAEGSFVITSVPTNNTFRYFAKSKVGTSNGQVLSTTYTQLREGGFYTGADISGSSTDIISQGSAGTIVNELVVPAGETIIPFDGPVPEVGAPLINANIPTGSQVTGVRATSAGGGVYITPTVVGDYPAGTTEITVEDATGVVLDLAANNGNGESNPVIDVNGNVITFQETFPNGFKGNSNTYTGVSGTNQFSIGTGAVFDISRALGQYSVDAIVNAGNDYEVGDRILIEGTNLGGLSPQHDLVLIITEVFSSGAVVAFDIEGAAFDGNASYLGETPVIQNGLGTGAAFDISYLENLYTAVDVGSPDLSEGYAVNDVIRISGDNVPGGASPANDLTITVTSIGAGGGITGVDFDGVAPNALDVFIDPAYTTSGSGVNAVFTVTKNGTIYEVNFDAGGTNYLPTDTITVLGTEIGGATPANDLQITIDNVDGNGAVTAFSISGTAVNGRDVLNLVGTNVVGADAVFDIETNGGTYNVTLVDGGTSYGPGQFFLLSGEDFVGLSPDNDLTITIDTVTAGGVIDTFTATGVAPAGSASYTNLATDVQQPSGIGAFFDVLRLNGEYITTVNQQGAGYQVGNRIVISGTQLGGASPLNDLELRIIAVENDGFIVDDSSSAFVQTYVEAPQGDILDLFSTITITEAVSSTMPRLQSIDYELLSTLEITFPNAHGLVPGSTFITTVTSDDGINNHALAAGSFFVTDIPTETTIRYQARAAGTIDTAGGTDPIVATVYPRPDSFFIHRPYDGGVQLGTGGPQHGAQAIRQSKKYIRYQSGKGIMYTTGALFAPSYDLRSLTADGVEVGSTITVVTDDNDHGVQEGGIIRLLGVETPGYNSGPETAVPPNFDYEVINVIDERTFEIRAQRRLGATEAILGFGSQMSVVAWHGATVRSGIFDDQNGIFWEFDGTQISVVQRTGTRQLAGTIDLNVDSNLISGTNTRFRDQLKAGDRIIIKGMTHVVSHVIDQTTCTITPDWRGVVDITGAKANLIVDKKTKQEEFNMDRLDGTGPSGYDIDIAKMQMIGIQYTWYGAGFIDFMLRGSDGNFVYAHRMRNSNVNTEAFMRSGNLPVRYEVTNEGPPGKLAENVDETQTTLPLVDTSFFPTSGTVYVDNEIITFTGNNENTNTLTGCTRAATFTNFQAGASRSYTAGDAATHDARTGVVLISQTITPLISHWGSAFLTDGGFDDDRGYIFSYSETGVEVSTVKQTAFLIRLAPSVSNAIVGDLGERELLNRAQLLLQGLEITSDGFDGGGNQIEGGIVVEGILNPNNYPLDPSNVGWSELSGVAQGGQPSFAQVAAGGSVVWSAGGGAVTATITAQSAINTGAISVEFGSYSNRNFFRVDRDNWEDSGASTGDFLISSTGGANMSGGLEITSVNGPYNYRGTRYYNISTSGSWSGTVSGSVVVQRRFTTTDRNFGYFDESSVLAAGIQIGTPVSETGGSVVFPANAQVNNIIPRQFNNIDYYEVQFNATYTGTITQGSGTVELVFEEPPYAEPGETVFSFIAVPGERSTLNLDQLKELTNTPLGGRGTFPNGPDVLAINVYKVAGAATNANLIIRWGEAQA